MSGNNRIHEKAERALIEAREKYPPSATDFIAAAVLAAVAHDQRKAPLWECSDCAFAFDAMHTDPDGGYSCPLCGEAKAEARADEMRGKWEAAWALAQSRAESIFELQAENGELRGRAARAEAQMADVEALASEWETVARDRLSHLGCLDMHAHLASVLRGRVARHRGGSDA